jgi:predicted dehydrogenase
VTWRDFWAFGCSRIGDFACHDLDAATWAFDLRDPVRVEGLAGIWEPDDADDGPPDREARAGRADQTGTSWNAPEVHHGS